MEYSVTNDEETKKEIDISIPSAELNRFIDDEVAKIKKDFTLNGFRKGKVPKDIIRSRHRDTLRAQAINSLAIDSFLKILKEKKWQPASQAELVNIEEGEIIKFRLRFETIPDFAVETYLGLEIFKEAPLPDDFLLERMINELRERNATIKEVAKPAVVDDFATLDIKITENDTVKSGQKDVIVVIGNRSLPDEINKALVGVKKTDKKKVAIGNQIYEFTVKKVEEKILPNFDDEFAKTENCKDVEDLKTKLKESAKKIEEKRIEGELKESLSQTILERNKFKVPESMIENEYKKILEKSNIPDSDANKERFRETAEKRARLNLILDKISKKENITIKEDEIVSLVSAMGMKLNNENRTNILNYLGSMLKREKTIDFLLKKAKISEKSKIISPKEVINDTSSLRH